MLFRLPLIASCFLGSKILFSTLLLKVLFNDVQSMHIWFAVIKSHGNKNSRQNNSLHYEIQIQLIKDTFHLF
jgi:hypothetical protein